MKRKLAALALAFLAAGCATPGNISGDTDRFEKDSAKTPREAAHCVARNAEKMTSGLYFRNSARIQPGEAPETMEVVHTGLGDAISVTLITPQPAGSRMVVRYHRSKVMGGVSPELSVEGC